MMSKRFFEQSDKFFTKVRFLSKLLKYKEN